MTNSGEGRMLAVGLGGERPKKGKWKKPPTVLLHAFPLDSRMWRPLASELNRRGKVVFGFDYPGFGATEPWPDIEPSIDAISEAAVGTLVEDLGARTAYWVGCSMGGYVALAIQAHYPDMVEGLGLVDTRATADDEQMRAKRLRMATEVEGLPALEDPRAMAEALIGLEGEEREAVLAEATAIIGSASPKAVAWGQRAMAGREDWTWILDSVGKLAAVVWGERDAITRLDEAEAMAEAIGVPLARIPGVGHLSPLEAPAAVAEALMSIYRG